MNAIYLLLLFCFIIGSECLPAKGNPKTQRNATHITNIAKKQQVLVPLGNFAASTFGPINVAMSPMFHLEGTNEVARLKEPTTVFLNGNNQASQVFVPDHSQQMYDNQGHLTEAPLEENNYRTDSSLFDTDEMESFRDSVDYKEDDKNGNGAFTGGNEQTTSYEQTNDEGYLNQSSEEEDSEPARAVVDYKNYDGGYVSNVDNQGLPTVSSMIASRLKAKDALSSFGLGHSAVGIPDYALMAKQLLKNKPLEVEKALELDSGMTAAKKDNSNTADIAADGDNERKSEDSKKQQYKAMVKNAELAANLAETAKTLTKLVKKLTEHEAMISPERKSRKNIKEAAKWGVWSPWSKWSSCSATCGGGLRYTKRNCTSLPSTNGTPHCSGRHIRVRMCNLVRCNAAHDKKVDLERSLSDMAEARSHIYKT